MDTTDLFAAAERQRGLVRRDYARLLGFPAKTQRRWIRSGEWEAVGKRLLRRAGAPIDRGFPLMRAVLDSGPGAVVSEGAGAAWWGLPGFDLHRIVVLRPRGVTGARTEFAAAVHEVITLSGAQITVLDGIPVVRPERLALDLFASCHPARAARAIETAWAKGLLSGSSLRAAFDELAASGRTGIVALREFIDAHPVDWVPPASNLEARFASIMAESACGVWRRQVDLGATTWVGRVDFCHVHLPLVVEVQSERYHAALLDQAADTLRKAKLSAAGFTVVEVWDTWIWHDKARVVRTVSAAIRAAARAA